MLIFSVSENLADLVRAQALGASGFLLKGSRRDEIVRAIHRAATGKNAWSRPLLRRISRAPAVESLVPSPKDYLTPRERDVLRKVTDGLVNEDIAEDLSIDVETVKHYIKRILKKIGVEDRTQAALWAVRNGVF